MDDYEGYLDPSGVDSSATQPLLFIGNMLWMPNKDGGNWILVGIEDIAESRVFGTHEQIEEYTEVEWDEEYRGGEA